MQTQEGFPTGACGLLDSGNGLCRPFSRTRHSLEAVSAHVGSRATQKDKAFEPIRVRNIPLSEYTPQP